MADMAGNAVAMLRNYVLLWIAVSSVCHASDNFIVTHAPNYLKFLPTEKQLSLSQVPDLITSSYGFSPRNELEWDGLSQGNLFRRPKANVIFSFDGFKDFHSLDNINHIANYPTHSDTHFVNTASVSDRLQSSVESPLIIDFSASNSVFDVKTHYPELFSRLPGEPDDVMEAFQRGDAAMQRHRLGSLNVSQPADLVLLAELELIQEMIDALKADNAMTLDNQPDLFHFRLSGYQMLLSSYPSDATALKDARILLKNFLDKATADFRRLYNDNVLVEVITMTGNVQRTSRKSRSLLQAAEAEPDLNLATSYDPDYPIVFNLVLWTVVVMALTVLFVSCGLWNMDPGRDSIIYRMTSQRMKKD